MQSTARNILLNLARQRQVISSSSSRLSRVCCFGVSASNNSGPSIMMSTEDAKDNSSTTLTTTVDTIKEDDDEVVVVPDGYEQIVEGKAKMIYRKKASCSSKQEVFYNPVQVQNRDLSILMLNLYAERRHLRNLEKKKKKNNNKNNNDNDKAQSKEEEKDTDIPLADRLNQTAPSDGLRILEALAASGLRSIRYSKEVSGVREIIVNDLDPVAVEQAIENVSFNRVDPNIVKPQQGDATHVLYNSREKGKQFDVIDLDPYGTAAPFLDGAVQAVTNGGLLCITCTDMRVLSGGGQADLCYSRYGAMPMPNGKYLHELALRILLQTISTSASRYGRTIRPILSVGMAFYIRVFVEVNDDSAGAQRSCLFIGNVYQSIQCPSFYTSTHGIASSPTTDRGGGGGLIKSGRGPPEPICTETGSSFKVAGPIWLGPLHDIHVVKEAIDRLENNNNSNNFKSHAMIHGLLTAVSEELIDVPLYYLLPDLCKTIGSATPPIIKIRAALTNAGYRCSGQHKEPMAIKTDAPPKVVWDIMRAWAKACTTNANSKEKLGVAHLILTKTTSEINVDFTIPPGFDKNKKKKVARFPMNPERDWGPKPRATGKRKADAVIVTQLAQGMEKQY